MHCFERTLWLLFFVVVTGDILCHALPTEAQKTNPSITISKEINHESDHDEVTRSTLNVPVQFETTTHPIGRLNLDVPHLRPPLNTGPGNYLEDRRRQTESRIQELETQVNLLLETQNKNGRNTNLDPERESQTAIQYGLNCARGETVLVCLMKKVVILRREVSGIQKDMSELGKRFTKMMIDIREMNTNQGKTHNGNKTEHHDGQEPDSQFPEVDNTTTITNRTTERPVDILPRQDPLCPTRFERVGNVCYYVVTDRANGVTSARDFCEANGGFLARPRDSLTIHDLANHLTRLHDKGNNQLSELWVDGQYQTEKETWSWNDGQKIDRSIWGISDTPTKAHGTDTCVLLKKELNYLAMPQDCGYHYFFVCQAETREDIPAM